jgi:hypothetical protein
VLRNDWLQSPLSLITNPTAKIANRVKQAATEYFMTLGTPGQLSISDLDCKHGLPHCNTLCLAVAAMEDQREALALALKFCNSKAVVAADPTAKSAPVNQGQTCYNSSVLKDMYKQAIVHTATLALGSRKASPVHRHLCKLEQSTIA